MATDTIHLEATAKLLKKRVRVDKMIICMYLSWLAGLTCVYICDAFLQVEEVQYMVLLECDALECFAVTMQPYWKRPVELSPANWPPLESIQWAMRIVDSTCYSIL